MKKEEKRRKFHDSLLQMLYPPPSPPPAPPQEHHQTPVINISSDSFQPDITNDDDDNDDILSSDGDESGQHKLTRAQRKRLRKKKLRQAVSQRRPIIGPLLPDVDNAPISEAVTTSNPPPVRHIAAEESVDNSDEQGASNNQIKTKQRRMAKKLVRDLKEQKDS